ncbi:unnamed protein product, partial [Ectocarpus sp. 12 AP-2014]
MEEEEQDEDDKEEEEQNSPDPSAVPSSTPASGQVVCVNGAMGEDEISIADFVTEHTGVLVSIFGRKVCMYVDNWKRGVSIRDMATLMARSNSFPGSPFRDTDIVKHIRDEDRGSR